MQYISISYINKPELFDVFTVLLIVIVPCLETIKLV